MAKQPLGQVTLCGGDPFTYPHVIEVIKLCKDLGLRVKVDTVGTVFLGANKAIYPVKMDMPAVSLKDLSRLVDCLSIPLDGWDQESVSYFRKGRKSLFEESLQIIEMAEKDGVPLDINTVVHKGNVHGVYKILDILNRYSSVKNVQLFQYMPIGELGYKNRKHFMLSDDHFLSALDLIRQNHYRFEVQAKTNAMRKNHYVMVDAFGQITSPENFYENSDGELVKEPMLVSGHIKDSVKDDLMQVAPAIKSRSKIKFLIDEQ